MTGLCAALLLGLWWGHETASLESGVYELITVLLSLSPKSWSRSRGHHIWSPCCRRVVKSGAAVPQYLKQVHVVKQERNPPSYLL